MKNSPISAKAMSPRKPIKGGEYNNDRNRTCRVVKYPTESTFAAASSRSVLFRSVFTQPWGSRRPAGVAVGDWPPFVPCRSR